MSEHLPVDLAEQPAPPAKITASANKKVKNPKRVAAGKRLAAKNKEKLAKIKAFEEQPSEVTESESVDNPDWSSSVLLLVVGVAVVGGAFGYQKWTSVKETPVRTTVKETPVRTEKNSDLFEDLQ